MPSATTKIPRSATMRKLSSFPERMIPTSVRPAQVMCTARRYANSRWRRATRATPATTRAAALPPQPPPKKRSEEHTSELQSRLHLVCRLLLEKKKKKRQQQYTSKLQQPACDSAY